MSREERERMMGLLHDYEAQIHPNALGELIRLLEAEDDFAEVTQTQINAVGEYKPISVGGKRYFGKAFTTGKEVSGILGIARFKLGREVVLEDLQRLQRFLENPEEQSS